MNPSGFLLLLVLFVAVAARNTSPLHTNRQLEANADAVVGDSESDSDLFPFESSVPSPVDVRKLKPNFDGSFVAKVTNDFNKLVAKLAKFSGTSEVCIRAFLLDIPFDLNVDGDDKYSDELANCPQNLDGAVKKYSKAHKIENLKDKKVAVTRNVSGVLEEDEAPRHRHKGEFEPITTLLMSIDPDSETSYFSLMSSLTMGALFNNKQVVVMTNDYEVQGGSGFAGREACFKNHVERDIFANLDRAKGQRLYYKNLIGQLKGRQFTEEERNQVFGRLNQLSDGSREDGLDVESAGAWIRDYGPLFTCEAQNPATRTSTGFAYRDVVRADPFDHAFPEAFADANAVPFERMKIPHGFRANPLRRWGLHAANQNGLCDNTHCQVLAEGGNLQVDGSGNCLISKHAAAVNKKFYRSRHTIDHVEGLIRDEMNDKLGCTNTIFLSNLYMEGTKHVDMYISFTARNRLVMGIYEERQDSRNRRIMLENKAILRRQNIRVDVMPMPSRCPLNELPQYLMTLARVNGGDLKPEARAELDRIAPPAAGERAELIFEWARVVEAFLDTEENMIGVVRLHVNPQAPQAIQRFNQLMRKMGSDFGVRKSCNELDVPADHAKALDDYKGSGFVHRSYANALIMENVVVVPIYEELLTRGDDNLRKHHKKTMKKAFKVWLKQPTINTVITGYADNQIANGGAAHCTSQTLRRCA